MPLVHQVFIRQLLSFIVLFFIERVLSVSVTKIESFLSCVLRILMSIIQHIVYGFRQQAALGNFLLCRLLQEDLTFQFNFSLRLENWFKTVNIIKTGQLVTLYEYPFQISLPKRNSNIIHFSIFTAMMLVDDLHNIYSNLNNTFLSLIKDHYYEIFLPKRMC